MPEWQDIRIGDRILFARGTEKRPPFGPVVAAFERDRSLVLSIGETTDPGMSVATWQFFLEPMGACNTRLPLHSRASTRRPVGLKLFDAVFEPGYQYMDIGMLRGIRDRAERMVPPVPGIALA